MSPYISLGGVLPDGIEQPQDLEGRRGVPVRADWAGEPGLRRQRSALTQPYRKRHPAAVQCRKLLSEEAAMPRRRRNSGDGPGGRRRRSSADDFPDLPDRRAMERALHGIVGQADPDTPQGQAQELLFQAFEEDESQRRQELAKQALA